MTITIEDYNHAFVSWLWYLSRNISGPGPLPGKTRSMKKKVEHAIPGLKYHEREELLQLVRKISFLEIMTKEVT